MTMRRATPLLLSLLLVGCGEETPEFSETEIPTAQSAPEEMAATTPFGGTPAVIPGVIEAENYDEGEPGVAYQDADPENQGADYRGVTQVDIEPRDDASNGHGIGWAGGGEWVTYTVEVQEAGTYTIEFPVASNGPGGTFHLEMDGQDVTGPINVPDTGSWQQLETIRAEGVELQQGRQTLRLVFDESGESGAVADIDLMRFSRTN